MEKYEMMHAPISALTSRTLKLMKNRPDSIPLSFYEKRLPENSRLAKAFPEYSCFGWFVLVPEETDEDENRIPQDLRKITESARKNGFRWIMFDKEAERISETVQESEGEV